MEAITGSMLVGRTDDYGLKVLVFKKVRISKTYPYNNISQLYILMDAKGLLYIAAAVRMLQVISNGETKNIIKTGGLKKAFGLRGDKKYFPNSMVQGVLTNFDQYGNMLIKACTNSTSADIKSSPFASKSEIFLTALEVALVRKQQKTKRQAWKQANGYYTQHQKHQKTQG